MSSGFLTVRLYAEDAPKPPTQASNAAASRDKKGEVTAATKPKSAKWTFSLLPIAFQKNPILDFTVVTELTDVGRKLPPPAFDSPVYYISHANRQHNEGPGVGGEKEILFSEMEAQLTRALSSNGYRPADSDHPATLVLFFIWGAHNKVETLNNVMSDSGQGMGRYDVDASNIQNLMSRAQLVGGKKFADEFFKALVDQANSGIGMGTILSPFRRFTERDDLTRNLVDQVFDDCYYMTVSAYDAGALAKNEKILLWRTKMTTAAHGVSLAQTMPGLIDNGAYFFGREMQAPEIVVKRVSPTAKVEIGEAVVKEYITGTNVSTSGTGTAKEAATGNTNTNANRKR